MLWSLKFSVDLFVNVNRKYHMCNDNRSASWHNLLGRISLDELITIIDKFQVTTVTNNLI